MSGIIGEKPGRREQRRGRRKGKGREREDRDLERGERIEWEFRMLREILPCL